MKVAEPIPDYNSDEELLADLGIEAPKENDITNLQHVKPSKDKRNVGEVASQTRCEDFDDFKSIFDSAKNDMDSGIRKTIKFRKDAGFSVTHATPGQLFILRGQMAYIADQSEPFKAPNGATDSRLRVIYSNGTESNMLQRSFIRRMYDDESSRLITNPDPGPLFRNEPEEGDLESGVIYVLRSQSDEPKIKSKRDILHKIGVTGGDVKKRISNARKSPTYLMADVEIVAEYKLYNINRTELEHFIHNFFAAARLDIEIVDRFGEKIKPQEWFIVPFQVIDNMVDKLKDGTLADYYYDPQSASLAKHKK